MYSENDNKAPIMRQMLDTHCWNSHSLFTWSNKVICCFIAVRWRKLSLSLQAASSSPASSSRSSSLASFPSCHWAGATLSAASAHSSASRAAAAAVTWWRQWGATWSTLLFRDSTSPLPAVRPSLPKSTSSSELKGGTFSWFKGLREKILLRWVSGKKCLISFCHMEVRGQSSISGAGRDSESRMPPALESWGVEDINFWIQSIFVLQITTALTVDTHPSVSAAELTPHMFDHEPLSTSNATPLLIYELELETGWFQS